MNFPQSVALHNICIYWGAGASGKRLLYVHALDEIYQCKITIRFCLGQEIIQKNQFFDRDCRMEHLNSSIFLVMIDAQF